jgi:uncharacterized membrane protein
MKSPTGHENHPTHTGSCADDGIAAPAAPRTRRSPRGSAGRSGGSSWRVPAALVALTVIPVSAGFLRLLELIGGPALLPTNPRVDASPAPVVLHVVAVAVYAFLGAFQFSARLRRRRPNWHRKSGRILVVVGLVVAGSGLWMTLFYPDAPGGDLLWAVRLLVGSAMAASIVLAFTAIRRRDIATHRAWMIRAYALAAGAGTQIFTKGIARGAFGDGDMSKALSVTLGGLINVAIAEWIIRRPAIRRARRARRARTRAVVVGAP